MNAPVKKPAMRNVRDHDGVILDLLDDIIRAENQAKKLVDRLDAIGRRSTLKIVDMDSYMWTIALIAICSFSIGMLIGYFLRGMHS